MLAVGYFLDILQTKGDNGVKKFLEILEWEYPHVFKDVTNKDAREPPTGKCVYVWGVEIQPQVCMRLCVWGKYVCERGLGIHPQVNVCVC